MSLKSWMNLNSWINVAVGLWLVFAAFALPHSSGTAVTEDVVAGLLVALGALWAAEAFRPRVSLVASWVVVLTGLWAIAAPFVLHYQRSTAAVANDMVAGVIIMALGLINTVDKARRMPTT
jgi:SPW repeat-containing protein